MLLPEEDDEEKELLPQPSLTRRMSSQFAVELDRQKSVVNEIGQQINAYVPEQFSRYIPGLNRSPTSQLKMTYFCNICFTKREIDYGFTLSTCQHQFCPECINSFLANKINNGIVNIKCFYPIENNNSCGETITENDIHQIVNAQTWSKYNKFKTNLQNIYSRQCPSCDYTQIGNPQNPMIKCENKQCEQTYCLYHSNAHSINMTCEQYELSIAKETKMNEMAIHALGDDAKKCPQCTFTIVKNGGCNHMRCIKCGCSFCWLCSEIIDDVEVPLHYSDANSACKGQQFSGMEMEPIPIGVGICMSICVVIFCIPASIMAIVCGTHPLWFCCRGCSREHNFFNSVFGCWVFWLIIFLIIFALLPLLVIFMVWGLLKRICSCLTG